MTRRPFAIPSLTRLWLVVTLALGGGSGGLAIGADAILIRRIAQVEMALVQLLEPANIVCTVAHIMDSLRRAREPEGRDLAEDDETHVFFVVMSIFFLFSLMWLAVRPDCLDSEDATMFVTGGGCCCVVIACVMLFIVGFNSPYDTAMPITLVVFISLYVMMLAFTTFRLVSDDRDLCPEHKKAMLLIELPLLGSLTAAFLNAGAARQLDEDLIPHKVILRVTQDLPAIIVCGIDRYSTRTTPNTITNIKLALSCFLFAYHFVTKFLLFAIELSREKALQLNVRVVPSPA